MDLGSLGNEVKSVTKEIKRRAERVIMQCREEADAVQSVSIRRAKHKLTSCREETDAVQSRQIYD